MAATQVPDAKLYEASQSLGSELGNAPLTELGELTFATLRGAANSAIEDATANGLPGLAGDFGIQQFFAAAQPGGGGTNVATGTFGEITASAAPAGLGVASPSQSGILSLSPSLQSLGAAGAGTSASPSQTNAAATPAIGSPNVLTSEETALAEGETAPADPTSNGEPSLPDVGVQPPDETVAASPGGVGAETSGGGVTGLPTGTEPTSGADTPVTDTNSNVNPDSGTEAGTDTGPVTSVDTVTGTGTGTGPTTGADTDPEMDTSTDTGSGTGPDTEAGPGPDADSDSGIDNGSDTGTNAGGNAEAGSGMDTVPDTGVDTGTNTGTGPSSSGDTGPGTDTGTVPQLGTETGIGPETDTGTGSGTGSDTGAGPGPDTGAGPGPDTGSEPGVDGGDDSGTGAGGNAQAGTGTDTGTDEGPDTDTTTGTGSGAGTDTGSNPGSGSTAEPLEPADAQDIGIDLTTDSDTLAGLDVELDPVERLLGTDIDLPITADLDLTGTAAPAAPGADEDLTIDLALTEPLTGDTLAGVDVGLDPVESLLGTDIDLPITADLDLTGTAAPADPGADEDLTIDLALTEPLTGDTLAGVDVGLDPVESLLGTDIDLPITADLDLTGTAAPADPGADEDLMLDLALTEPLTGDTLAGVDVGLDPVESLLGTDIDLPITADLDLTGIDIDLPVTAEIDLTGTAAPASPGADEDLTIDLALTEPLTGDTLAGVDVGLDPVEALLGTDIDLPITADLDLTGAAAPADPGADEDLTIDLALTEPLTGDTLAGLDVGLDPVESLLGTDIDLPVTADLDLTGTAAPASPGADEDLTLDLALTEPLTGDTLAGVDVGLDPVETLLGTDIDLPVTADLGLTGTAAPAAPGADEDLTIDLALTEPLTGDTLAGVDVGLDPVETLLGTDIDLPITADLDLTGAPAPAAPAGDEDLTIDLALTEPLTGDTLAGVDVGLDPVETLLGTDIDLPVTAEIDVTNLFTELGSITPSSTTVEELASPTVETTSDALVAAGSLLTDSIANATENLISADTLFNADFGTSSEAVAGTDTQAATEINLVGFDLLETTSSVATDLTGAVSGSGLSAGIESTVTATTSSLTGTLKSLFG